jgi:hypothetical protein
MKETVYEGLPTMSLLPLAPTRFKVVDEIMIKLPRRGNYNEISPEVFDEAAGDFDLLVDGVLYMPSITRVLLATNQYPNLEGNQIFTPQALLFNDDSVEIKGSIIEILSVMEGN